MHKDVAGRSAKLAALHEKATANINRTANLNRPAAPLTENHLPHNTLDTGIIVPEYPTAEMRLSRQLHPSRNKSIAKFIGFSALGLFLFLAPIPTGNGAFNIPLGVAISWLEANVLQRGEINFSIMLLLAVTTISALGSALAAVTNLGKNNTWLKRAFKTSPVYLVSRVLAAAFAWMIFTGFGPEFIVNDFTGGVMLGIAAHLIAVFIFLGFAIPILTDFGVMEFVGALVSRVVRRLFTLPGRAAVDLVASWFGSSVAGVILTRDQHEKGHYSGREAAVIATNFAFVSLPFSFVIANTIGIENHFLAWYLIICVVAIVLAIVTPRIWPLRSLADTHLRRSSVATTEETIPAGTSRLRHGFEQGVARAEKSTLRDVATTGLRTYVDIYADLIPVILAWGTLSLAIFEFTPVFQFISQPMGWYMALFGIEGAAQFAPAALIGFLDMFLPAILVAEPYAALSTQLIIGGLAIVQIIYMTETGVTILKSRIPLNIGKLFAIFMIRTLIAIPLLTAAVWGATQLGLF